MEQQLPTVLNLVLCLALLPACGDGDEDPKPGSATGGTVATGGATTGGAGTTGGVGTTGGSGTTGGTGEAGGGSNMQDQILTGQPCDPAADTTCQNEASCGDVASGLALYSAHMVLDTCVRYPDEYCIEVGMANATDLSMRCEGCYTDLALCMDTRCTEICRADPLATDCGACRDSQGCTATFEACAEL